MPAKKKSTPLEKEVEKKVCDYAKRLSLWMNYKFTSPSRRSVPDRIFIGKIVFWIEFKRFGEKPTPAQEVEITKIREKGKLVFIIDEIQDGKNLFDALNGGLEVIPKPGFAPGFLYDL